MPRRSVRQKHASSNLQVAADFPLNKKRKTGAASAGKTGAKKSSDTGPGAGRLADQAAGNVVLSDCPVYEDRTSYNEEVIENIQMDEKQLSLMLNTLMGEAKEIRGDTSSTASSSSTGI